MRAEERCTRALIDLELQDAWRLDRARREAEEAVKMGLEELETREFNRLERAQIVEQRAMETEDQLSRIWEDIKR